MSEWVEKSGAKALTAFGIFCAILICWNPHLGPIDDTFFLQPYKVLNFWYNDRFYILDGIEQFMVTQTFGVQPFLYYLINALEFLVLFYLIIRISKKAFEPSPRMAFLVPIIVALTPGVTTAYLRLLVPERLLVLCMSVIVFLDQETIKDSRRKILYVTAAAIGMLLKEPTFLLIGGLSFFRYLEKKDRKFHLGMMLLSATYLIVYIILTRVISPASAQYGSGNIHGLPLLAKNIFNYTLNDPAVFLFAIPTWILLAFRKRLLDPQLSLVCGYTLILLYLGIYQEYYLLPILPFLIVAAGKYWASTPRLQKILLTVLLLNGAVYGLGQVSIYKNEPKGFIVTIQTLANENFKNKKTVCYLGLKDEYSHEILWASEVFFAREKPDGVPPLFQATENSNDPLCDYLIDSPYNYSSLTPALDWRTVHHFEPTLAIPSISIRTWIKYFTSKIGSTALVNQNIFRKHDFVILKR